MTENELIDEIRDYVHNIHTAEPFHGFSFRELREVGEHFALPREKRIEELEKENTRMKKDGDDLSKKFDYQVKRVMELEKENAELKKLKRECETSLCRAEYQYNYEQLTKAKELIKTLLLIADNKVSQMEFQLCVADAKQFLKE